MKTKLTPYLREVYEWRMHGHTWREIEVLLGEKGVKTSYSQVRRWFMNQRKKGRELQEVHEDLKLLLQKPSEPEEEPQPTPEEVAKEAALIESYESVLRGDDITGDTPSNPTPDPAQEDWEKELEEDYKKQQENKPKMTRF